MTFLEFGLQVSYYVVLITFFTLLSEWVVLLFIPQKFIEKLNKNKKYNNVGASFIFSFIMSFIVLFLCWISINGGAKEYYFHRYYDKGLEDAKKEVKFNLPYWGGDIRSEGYECGLRGEKDIEEIKSRFWK